MIEGITAAQWLNAGSSVLGKALSPAPAAPSTALSGGAYTNAPDHSGWTVSTGGGTAYGTPPALKAPSVSIIAIVAVAALLGVVLWKKL
ncbi:MAG: hypothetical protein DI561_15045 [Thauera sp.]|nr:MAG: hypothetical protein DI561_15045 [Thauera sp.]